LELPPFAASAAAAAVKVSDRNQPLS